MGGRGRGGVGEREIDRSYICTKCWLHTCIGKIKGEKWWQLQRSFILRGNDDNCMDLIAKWLDKITGRSDVNYRLYKRAREQYYASPDGSIFFILPRNHRKENLIVELLWWQWPSSTQGHNAEVHLYQKSKDRRGKGENTHTGLKIRYRGSSRVKRNYDSTRLKQVEAKMAQNSKVTKWWGVAGYKIESQCKGGVGADSMSSLKWES